MTGTFPLRAAFALITASFVATAVYTQSIVRQMDAHALAITENAGPAIAHLAAVRSDVRRIESLLAQYVNARRVGAEASVDEIEASRALLGREVGEYFALPAFADERSTWARFNEQLLIFGSGTTRALHAVDAGDFTAAEAIQRGPVSEAANTLASMTMNLVAHNARAGHDLAVSSLELRRRAETLTYVLVAACVVLAGSSLCMLEKVFRRNHALAAEQTRSLNDRAAELESFAARVAHDVLSPLTGAGFALAAMKRTSEPEKHSALVLRAERSVFRVRCVVDGLLAFARAGARPERGAAADVRAVVSGVLDDVKDDARAAGIELSAQVDPNLLSIACSEGILVSLVSNLVRNAIKYMGERPIRRVTVAIAAKGNVVRIEVSDTGPGIPASALPTLFEPYVRATRGRQPGLGLGLATVKRLAEGHGGQVGLSSIEGGGTAFWVHLPNPPPAHHTLVAASA